MVLGEILQFGNVPEVLRLLLARSVSLILLTAANTVIWYGSQRGHSLLKQTRTDCIWEPSCRTS